MKRSPCPHLIIVSGANGSGKTTFAQRYVAQQHLHFINADIIATSLNPTNIGAVKIQAGKQFFSQLDTHLHSHHSFAIESTLSGQYLIKVIHKARKLGFLIKIIYLFLDDPSINIARVQTRVLAGGHSIPEVDIIRRFHRSKYLFWHTYRLLCDDWQLFYNADTLLELVAVGNDTLDILNDHLFQLFLKGLKP